MTHPGTLASQLRRGLSSPQPPGPRRGRLPPRTPSASTPVFLRGLFSSLVVTPPSPRRNLPEQQGGPGRPGRTCPAAGRPSRGRLPRCYVLFIPTWADGGCCPRLPSRPASRRQRWDGKGRCPGVRVLSPHQPPLPDSCPVLPRCLRSDVHWSSDTATVWGPGQDISRSWYGSLITHGYAEVTGEMS